MKMKVEEEQLDEYVSVESSISSEDPDRHYTSLSEPSSDYYPASESSKGDTQKKKKKKFGRKANSFAFRVKEHVKMGPKLSETVKGKLSVGARIIKEGGRENIFRHIFGVTDGEKLLKASQCYLSTTAGPIAGFLFISTQKIAFCGERSITLPSGKGQESVRTPYKVLIPVTKIKEANERENANRPAQKYIEIVTMDNFEFWFMGFVRYEKALLNLQKAISMSSLGESIF